MRSGGAAATSRTCCIELVEAKPSPQIATAPAINDERAGTERPARDARE